MPVPKAILNSIDLAAVCEEFRRNLNRQRLKVEKRFYETFTAICRIHVSYKSGYALANTQFSGDLAAVCCERFVLVGKGLHMLLPAKAKSGKAFLIRREKRQRKLVASRVRAS